jgi:phenylpyruvate tautomerase PptA (4-oxalocrotonate tautomerase family)
MPFVRSSTTGYDPAVTKAAGDCVHRAMVDTIDVPAADRFQIVTAHAPGEMIWDRTFLGVDRSSDRAVFVHITLARGRDEDKKRALYAAIAHNLEDAGVRPADVLVTLVEVERSNWSFGNGIAQYTPGAPASV